MQSKKLIESEFIVKITDMMKEHPDIVTWNDNGTQLYLSNIDIFCQKVLPQYFRHSNFNSFIRQLNIYSFNKTKKVGKSMSFKNDIFKKGNENNFFLIQRKKKFKELQNFQERFEKDCEDLISQINSKSQITPEAKEVLISLLEYRYVSYVNLKRMKCELDALQKDLKDSRNKKIQDICTQIKSDLLSSISQLSSEAKKIDELISHNFLKESQETKQSLQQIPNQKLFNRPFDSVFNYSHIHSKNGSIMKEDSFEKGQHTSNQIKENIRSLNSVQVFLQEYKTKKQQMAYEHKLYHPFNSQNSFMFLPNYMGGPSHIPFQGKYSSIYYGKTDDNADFLQKNQTFDDYDQSASISFVKDFTQQQIGDFYCQN